jgi:hypothetical protein
LPIGLYEGSASSCCKDSSHEQYAFYSSICGSFIDRNRQGTVCEYVVAP